MLLMNILNDLLVLLFQQFQIFIDFKHCLTIVSALLHQNHLLFQVILYDLCIKCVLAAVKLCLLLLRHSREIKLEMDEMSKLVLLTDVHCLGIGITITLIQNAGESALEVSRAMELEDTVVQERRHPLCEL